MYKMILADDNSRELESLKTVLDWEAMGIELITTCSNGKEALDKAIELDVNIIISDVEMPKMSGLEMLKEIQKLKKDIKVVFVSCYDDFAFVKSALDMEAFGYVLKPIIPGELKKAVQKILDICEDETNLQQQRSRMLAQFDKFRPLMEEQFFRQLLLSNSFESDMVSKNIEFLKLDIINKSKIQVANVRLEEPTEDNKRFKLEDKLVAIYALKELLKEIETDEVKIYLTSISNDQICALVFSSIQDEDFIIDMLIGLKEEFFEQYAINISMGISNLADSIQDIHTLYQQSSEALETQFYSSTNRVIMYDEIEEKEISQSGAINISTLQAEIREIALVRNDGEIMGLIDKYLGDDKKGLDESYVKSFVFSVVIVIELLIQEVDKNGAKMFDHALIWDKLSKFNSILNIRQWLYNIFLMAFESMGKLQVDRPTLIANQIKQVIEEHYSEHLTLERIAEYIHFSVLHANNIFKKKTGNTIFDYLTEYRIERAKEFLREPNSKIYIVAQNTGYKNKAHFAVTFKQYVGLTPMEYKMKS